MTGGKAPLRCLAWMAMEASELTEALAYARQSRATLVRMLDDTAWPARRCYWTTSGSRWEIRRAGHADLDRRVTYLDASGNPPWRGKCTPAVGCHLAAPDEDAGTRAA